MGKIRKAYYGLLIGYNSIVFEIDEADCCTLYSVSQV